MKLYNFFFLVHCVAVTSLMHFELQTKNGRPNQNRHWKLGQQTPSFGITLAYLATMA